MQELALRPSAWTTWSLLTIRDGAMRLHYNATCAPKKLKLAGASWASRATTSWVAQSFGLLSGPGAATGISIPLGPLGIQCGRTKLCSSGSNALQFPRAANATGQQRCMPLETSSSFALCQLQMPTLGSLLPGPAIPTGGRPNIVLGPEGPEGPESPDGSGPEMAFVAWQNQQKSMLCEARDVRARLACLSGAGVAICLQPKTGCVSQLWRLPRHWLGSLAGFGASLRFGFLLSSLQALTRCPITRTLTCVISTTVEVYLILSMIAFIFGPGLGEGRGEYSAYSIFNKGQKHLLGDLRAEQLDAEQRRHLSTRSLKTAANFATLISMAVGGGDHHLAAFAGREQDGGQPDTDDAVRSAGDSEPRCQPALPMWLRQKSKALLFRYETDTPKI
eukprot:g17720.t1